jgi:hypothetical protein
MSTEKPSTDTKTDVEGKVSGKPKALQECAARINSLIESDDFKFFLDCLVIIRLLKKACVFQDDAKLANFSIIVRHDKGFDTSDTEERDQKHLKAKEELHKAGVDIEDMWRCFYLCPIIREQVITAMAFKGQM